MTLRSLSVLALLLAPLSAAAQSTPGLGAEREVGMAAWIRPGLSPLAGGTLPLLGIGAALRLSPAIEVGGEGIVGLREVRLDRDRAGDGTELSLGYGGVRFNYNRQPSRGSGFTVGFLFGAGTARMRSALVDAELGTANFFIVEPSLAFRHPVTERLDGGVWAGYRFTPGARALAGMTADEYRGAVVSLVLSFVRDP